jgi:hypothetical protein
MASEPRLTNIEELKQPGADKVLEMMGELSRQYDHFLISSPDHHTDRPPGLHASEISPCALKAYFTITGMEKKIIRKHSKWRKRFEHGTAIHEILQRNFSNMASLSGGLLEFDPEVEISPKTSALAELYNIYSHCDGVFRFYKECGGTMSLVGKLALEIKSASPVDYEKTTKPKQEHVEQGHVYMACLDIPAIYYMYFNKGNENIKPSNGNFLVRFNNVLWDKLIRRFDSWYDLIDFGRKPERTETIVCEFCPYSWTCKPDYLQKYSRETVQRTVRFRR